MKFAIYFAIAFALVAAGGSATSAKGRKAEASCSHYWKLCRNFCVQHRNSRVTCFDDCSGRYNVSMQTGFYHLNGAQKCARR